jgi:hypothetical protein
MVLLVTWGWRLHIRVGRKDKNNAKENAYTCQRMLTGGVTPMAACFKPIHQNLLYITFRDRYGRNVLGNLCHGV